MYNECNDWLPVRNSRFLSTPPKLGGRKARKAQSGRPIHPQASSNAPRPFPVRPSPRSTTGCRPGQSVCHRQTPGDLSANTWPPRSSLPSTTSDTRMCPGPSASWECPVSEMYSRDSSGKKHSPLDFTRSPAATVASPSAGQRPAGSKEAVTSCRE